MTEKRKRRPPVEDEAQSQRFIDLARELEAEGDLEREDDALERALDKLKTAHPPRN